jgi:hypothetical protein
MNLLYSSGKDKKNQKKKEKKLYVPQGSSLLGERSGKGTMVSFPCASSTMIVKRTPNPTNCFSGRIAFCSDFSGVFCLFSFRGVSKVYGFEGLEFGV